MNTNFHSPSLDPRQAADYLGFKYATLNNSRSTGLLCGARAPSFRKIGKSIRYQQSALDAWLAQFKEQTSTSETPNNAA